MRDFAKFVAPATIFYVLIMVLPITLGVYYSLTEWNGVDQEARWIGIQNYLRLFATDSQALASFWFTIRFTLSTVVISNTLAFALALALSQPLKFRALFRAVFVLPNVIGGIILGFIWRFIFVRVFPSVGSATGISLFSLNWLGDPFTGYWGSVLVFVWKTTGYLMLVYMAAIVSIDSNLLEAAEIDGARPLQRLFRLIIPLVAPAFTICLFLSLSWSFKIFDVIFALTQGGPFRSTEAFALNIYFEAFSYSNYGMGAAKAVFFLVVVGAITLLQVRLTQRKEVAQ